MWCCEKLSSNSTYVEADARCSLRGNSRSFALMSNERQWTSDDERELETTKLAGMRKCLGRADEGNFFFVLLSSRGKNMFLTLKWKKGENSMKTIINLPWSPPCLLLQRATITMWKNVIDTLLLLQTNRLWRLSCYLTHENYFFSFFLISLFLSLITSFVIQTWNGSYKKANAMCRWWTKREFCLSIWRKSSCNGVRSRVQWEKHSQKREQWKWKSLLRNFHSRFFPSTRCSRALTLLSWLKCENLLIDIRIISLFLVTHMRSTELSDYSAYVIFFCSTKVQCQSQSFSMRWYAKVGKSILY